MGGHRETRSSRERPKTRQAKRGQGTAKECGETPGHQTGGRGLVPAAEASRSPRRKRDSARKDNGEKYRSVKCRADPVRAETCMLARYYADSEEGDMPRLKHFPNRLNVNSAREVINAKKNPNNFRDAHRQEPLKRSCNSDVSRLVEGRVRSIPPLRKNKEVVVRDGGEESDCKIRRKPRAEVCLLARRTGSDEQSNSRKVRSRKSTQGSRRRRTDASSVDETSGDESETDSASECMSDGHLVPDRSNYILDEANSDTFLVVNDSSPSDDEGQSDFGHDEDSSLGSCGQVPRSTVPRNDLSGVETPDSDRSELERLFLSNQKRLDAMLEMLSKLQPAIPDLRTVPSSGISQAEDGTVAHVGVTSIGDDATRSRDTQMGCQAVDMDGLEGTSVQKGVVSPSWSSIADVKILNDVAPQEVIEDSSAEPGIDVATEARAESSQSANVNRSADVSEVVASSESSDETESSRSDTTIGHTESKSSDSTLLGAVSARPEVESGHSFVGQTPVLGQAHIDDVNVPYCDRTLPRSNSISKRGTDTYDMSSEGPVNSSVGGGDGLGNALKESIYTGEGTQDSIGGSDRVHNSGSRSGSVFGIERRGESGPQVEGTSVVRQIDVEQGHLGTSQLSSSTENNSVDMENDFAGGRLDCHGCCAAARLGYSPLKVRGGACRGPHLSTSRCGLPRNHTNVSLATAGSHEDRVVDLGIDVSLVQTSHWMLTDTGQCAYLGTSPVDEAPWQGSSDKDRVDPSLDVSLVQTSHWMLTDTGQCAYLGTSPVDEAPWEGSSNKDRVDPGLDVSVVQTSHWILTDTGQCTYLGTSPVDHVPWEGSSEALVGSDTSATEEKPDPIDVVQGWIGGDPYRSNTFNDSALSTVVDRVDSSLEVSSCKQPGISRWSKTRLATVDQEEPNMVRDRSLLDTGQGGRYYSYFGADGRAATVVGDHDKTAKLELYQNCTRNHGQAKLVPMNCSTEPLDEPTGRLTQNSQARVNCSLARDGAGRMRQDSASSFPASILSSTGNSPQVISAREILGDMQNSYRNLGLETECCVPGIDVDEEESHFLEVGVRGDASRSTDTGREVESNKLILGISVSRVEMVQHDCGEPESPRWLDTGQVVVEHPNIAKVVGSVIQYRSYPSVHCSTRVKVECPLTFHHQNDAEPKSETIEVWPRDGIGNSQQRDVGHGHIDLDAVPNLLQDRLVGVTLPDTQGSACLSGRNMWSDMSRKRLTIGIEGGASRPHSPNEGDQFPLGRRSHLLDRIHRSSRIAGGIEASCPKNVLGRDEALVGEDSHSRVEGSCEAPRIDGTSRSAGQSRRTFSVSMEIFSIYELVHRRRQFSRGCRAGSPQRQVIYPYGKVT